MKRARFHVPPGIYGMNPQMAKHSGQTCEIVRPLTPMYLVRFADGFEIDAYADELTEEES